MRTSATIALSLPLSLSLCLAACNTGRQTALLEALDGYHRGVRWGEADVAAGYLPPAQRASFFARHEAAADLKVTRCEIKAVRLKGDDKAEALIHLDWYTMRQARLRRTVLLQTWSRAGGAWQVVAQRWVKGTPFPLVGVHGRPKGAAGAGAAAGGI